jgi:hypothetical protein
LFNLSGFKKAILPLFGAKMIRCDMNYYQALFLLSFAGLNFVISGYAFYECAKKKNAFGETPLLYLLGMYVWGDATVFGIFWGFAAIVTLFFQDFVLFLLIVSLFWLVRSVGETIYWFNQQFSTIVRYDVQRLPAKRIFHNDSVWFVFQIMNQCLTVITIITSLYLAKVWLTSF